MLLRTLYTMGNEYNEAEKKTQLRFYLLNLHQGRFLKRFYQEESALEYLRRKLKITINSEKKQTNAWWCTIWKHFCTAKIKKLYKTFYGNENYVLHCKLHPDEWHIEKHKKTFKTEGRFNCNTAFLDKIFINKNYNMTTYKETNNCIFFLENSETTKYKQTLRIMVNNLKLTLAKSDDVKWFLFHETSQKMRCIRHKNKWMHRSLEDNTFQLNGTFRCNFEKTEKIIYKKSIDLINSLTKYDLYTEKFDESIIRLNCAIQKSRDNKSAFLQLKAMRYNAMEKWKRDRWKLLQTEWM